MSNTAKHPPWPVVVVCGASGVGKSSVARQLAARYAMPLAESDDIVIALQAMTTSHQQPMLHYWNTHPEALAWPPEKIAELHFALAEAMRPAFEAVIADHVNSGTRVVFEGDYLLPDLTAGFGGAVRAVVIEETDQDRLVSNFRTREPDVGEQRQRARVSVLVGSQLAQRASRSGTPVVAAWPWADRLDRVDRALRAIPRLTAGRSYGAAVVTSPPTSDPAPFLPS